MSHNNIGLALSRFVLRPFLITSVFLIAGMVGSASAQTNVLRGTVSVNTANGPSDRLPGASVNLVSGEAGKSARTTVTNDQGEYEFTNVSTGTYTLQVSLTGFKESSSNVIIRAGEPVEENVQLEVEDVSGNVTVTADADELNVGETSH